MAKTANKNIFLSTVVAVRENQKKKVKTKNKIFSWIEI